MAANKLTAKQQRFIEEYLIDLNATQAAIRAGYSEKTAFQTGTENLKKPNVATAITAAKQERSKRTEITQDMVIREMAKLAFSNMADYIEVNDVDGTAYLNLKKLTRDQAAAITELTCETYQEKDGDDFVPVKKCKIKIASKEGPLEKLGKHLGMFVERHEHTGKDGKPIALTFAELVRTADNDGSD